MNDVMETFEGKVAVITGGAAGIGLALARVLASEGARLVLGDIEQSALDAAVADLGANGADVIGHRCDVSQLAEVEVLADVAEERFGAIHIAVNNAGVAAGGAAWDVDHATWEWVLGVDLWGVIHGVRTFVPRIIAAGGGHVVNTASMAGLTSTPFMGPYNVAKHGVVTLSETMFHELALLHPEVGVTVVCPGWVRTGINRSERNRPDAVSGDDELSGPEGGPAAGVDLKAMIDGLIEAGLEPDDVAAQIVDAIRHRRFYVVTHQEWASAVTQRAGRIVDGENPQMMIPGND